MNQKTKELNRLNNELDQQISKENQPIFTDMICYLRGANISEYDQEIVRQDLTEMILSAQTRGESVHQVIGEDYKAFCDSVIASLPPKTIKQSIIDFLDVVCGSLSVLLAINILISKDTIFIIRDLIAGNSLNFNISFSVGSVISMAMILAAAIIIVEVILKNSFRIEKKKKRIVRAFLIGVGITAIFLLIAWLGKQTLLTINIFLAMVVVLALYLMHKVLERIE